MAAKQKVPEQGRTGVERRVPGTKYRYQGLAKAPGGKIVSALAVRGRDDDDGVGLESSSAADKGGTRDDGWAARGVVSPEGACTQYLPAAASNF